MGSGLMPLLYEGKMRKIKSPWDFTQPKYDERSSCYINAGSHHGVGKTQPVGSEKHSMKGAVPIGRPPQLKVSEVPIRNLPIEVES